MDNAVAEFTRLSNWNFVQVSNVLSRRNIYNENYLTIHIGKTNYSSMCDIGLYYSDCLS